MPLLVRLFRLVWGDDVDQALRPLLAVSLVGSLARSAGWSFVGIWAIRELGAGQRGLGLAFLVGALAGAASGTLGGHLSDHRGRRPLILVGWGFNAVFGLLFLAVGHHVLFGLALLVLPGLFGAVGAAADQAMIADLVAPGRQEAAYASMRVAANLGTTLGLPVGSAFLLLGSWPTLFVGVSAISALGFLLALRFVPARGAYAPEGPPSRGSLGVIRRDRPFLVYLLSAGLAWLVYVAFETVLPISLVGSHGLRPSLWGFLVIVNPALVTFGQLRLTRRVAHVPAPTKLVVAMLLMGLPFLLLSVSGAIPVIVLILFLFVLGEMLWVPTSQAVIATLAPEDVRGAYMGAFGSAASFGFALAPFVGLQVRAAFGDSAMWAMFAAISVAAAASSAYACRAALARREPLATSAAIG